MNFLFLTNSAYPLYVNGAATQVELTALELTKLGHKVKIVSTHPDIYRKEHEIIERDGIERIYLALGLLATNSEAYLFTTRDYNNPDISEPLNKILTEFKPDIVHVNNINGLGANCIQIVEQFNKDIPIFLTMHDYWWVSTFQFMSKPNKEPYLEQIVDKELEKKQAYAYDNFIKEKSNQTPEEFVEERDKFLRSMLLKTRRIVCVSKSFAEDVIANVPEIQDKIVVIPNGVKYPSIDYSEKIKNKDFNKKHLNFIFTSGQNDYKGAGIVMHAFKKLHKEYPNIHLHIYQHRQGMKRWWFRAFRKIRKYFYFRDIELNWQYDVNNLDNGFYKFADIVLSPSIVKESYGLVAREAMVRGVPSIVTDAGGFKDDFINEQNCLTIPRTFNFNGELNDALESQMRRLIEDRNLYKKLSENCLKTNIPSIEESVKKYVELYNS